MYPSHKCPFCKKYLWVGTTINFCLDCKRGDLSEYTAIKIDNGFIYKIIIDNYYIVTSNDITTIYNLISDAIIETIVVIPKFIYFDLNNKVNFLAQINKYTIFS